MDVRIEPIDLERDLPEICAVHENAFGRKSLEIWQRRMRWQFVENPAARIAAPRLYAARNAAGEVLGILGSFPARLKIGEREVITFEGADLSVLKAARGLGLGSRMVAAYVENEPVITIAHGTAAATARIFEKMGLVRIQADPGMLRLADPGPVAMHLARAGKLSLDPGKLPSRAALGFASLAARGWLAVRNRLGRPKPSPGISVRPVSEIGSEFDALWQRTAPRFPIAFVHDAEFLRWRFLRDPTYPHRLMAARGAGGELLGWVDTVATEFWGTSACFIMDFFCDPERVEVIDALLHAVLTACAAEGVNLVYCRGLHASLRARTARAFPLRPRRHDFPAYVKWKGEPELAEFVVASEHWHITHADGDVGFFMGG